MDPNLLDNARFHVPMPPRSRQQMSGATFRAKGATAPKKVVVGKRCGRKISVKNWVGIGATVLTMMFAGAAHDVLRKPTNPELAAYKASWMQRIDNMGVQCATNKTGPSGDVVTILVNGQNFGVLDCGNLERQSAAVLTQIGKQSVMPDILLRTTGTGPYEKMLPSGNDVIAGPFPGTAFVKHVVSSALRFVGVGCPEQGTNVRAVVRSNSL